MEVKKIPAVFKFDEPPHIMVIEARYYDNIADLLLAGVRAVLDGVKATFEIVTVPGAMEIPSAINYAVKGLNFDATRRRYDGYVALGCVIKGGTQHDEIVARESAAGLQRLALQHTLAIGNGILTVNNFEQALERADAQKLNRGAEAAEACLRLIELKQKYRLSMRRRWVGKV